MTDEARAEPIRVLIVEDSLTIRGFLADVIGEAVGFAVVGEAGDGQSAIELCQRLKPDVITMDMMLPVMSGLAATEYIMAYCPTPILIVSASTNRGELFRTYDALAAGAVDVLDKPHDAPDDEWIATLLSAIRVVSRIRAITHPRARLAATRAPAPPMTIQLPPPPSGSARRPLEGTRRLVAMGASTGGPGAVLTILRTLPPSFSLPIILVMHIAEPFGAALADWLDAQTRVSVRYVNDGERVPEPGTATMLMARPGRHLIVERERLRLVDGPERWSCRPAVDVLFESLVDVAAGSVGCLLTGMGRDGASGLLALRQAGAMTIAQDEASSVIFGMPGEAVRLGAATHVLPLSEIATWLARLPGATRGAAS